MDRVYHGVLRLTGTAHHQSEVGAVSDEFPSLTDSGEWFAHSWNKVSELGSLWRAWAPFLENGLAGQSPVDVLLLAYVAIGFMSLAVVGSVWARGRRAWPVAVSYLVLFVLYRIYFLPQDYYQWYYGPFMALAAVAAAAGLAAMGRLLPRVAIAASCALAVAFSVHLPSTFVLEQRVQQQIEDRVRMPMATYLDNVVEPGERVVSESAGYVGYYSHVTLYDFPGLTSPGALRALETLEPNRRAELADFTNVVRPEWLVMRPDEWGAFERRFRPLRRSMTSIVCLQSRSRRATSATAGSSTEVSIARSWFSVESALPDSAPRVEAASPI